MTGFLLALLGSASRADQRAAVAARPLFDVLSEPDSACCDRGGRFWERIVGSSEGVHSLASDAEQFRDLGSTDEVDLRHFCERTVVD